MSEIKVENKNVEKKESSLESIRKSLKVNMKNYTMFIALIFIGLLFTVLTRGIFFTSRNLSNLLLQTAYVAIVACGMLLVIVIGHIDLSVGSICGFTGAIAAMLQVNYGWPTVPVIIVTLLVGFLAGAWQGAWVAYGGLPGFVVTLGGWLLFRGLVIGVTKGQTIAPLHDSFTAIGQGYLPSFVPNSSVNYTSILVAVIAIVAYVFFQSKSRKSRQTYGFEIEPAGVYFAKTIAVSVIIALFFLITILYMGIPYSILIVIGLVLLFVFITNKTSFGRYVYAIGGNKEAARLSGINIKRTTMLVFIIIGVLSAVSGLVFTARLDSATASAGNLLEMDAIAACYIGGASTLGGEGTIIGAMIGALIMSTINNGMSLLNASTTWQYVVKGLILMLAVFIDFATRKKK
ncbi:MAG: sugar ABC transporter permease [Clostridiaceae bacterium]